MCRISKQYCEYLQARQDAKRNRRGDLRGRPRLSVDKQQSIRLMRSKMGFDYGTIAEILDISASSVARYSAGIPHYNRPKRKYIGSTHPGHIPSADDFSPRIRRVIAKMDKAELVRMVSRLMVKDIPDHRRASLPKTCNVRKAQEVRSMAAKKRRC